uniref:Uncharacterized protein n=1 Tax=Anguilla anguilla TaxID=7936 RepID=A0A0E9PD49_ANGAN
MAVIIYSALDLPVNEPFCCCIITAFRTHHNFASAEVTPLPHHMSVIHCQIGCNGF